MTGPRQDVSLQKRGLHGMHIVLSGSIPEQAFWSTPHDDLSILEFVRDFAGLVFAHGGRIVHGCHPSFTPILVHQARRFGPGEGGEKRLVLLMSEIWAGDPQSLPSTTGAAYADAAEFWITRRGPESPEDKRGVQSSLSILRRQLIAMGNLVVAVGGKHQGVARKPGIDEEIGLAVASRRPTFLVGGLGGRVAKLPGKQRAQLIEGDLLTEALRKELIRNPDATAVLGQLLAHLLQNRDALLARSHRDELALYGAFVGGAFGETAPHHRHVLERLLPRILERTTELANRFAAALHTRQSRLQTQLSAAVQRRLDEPSVAKAAARLGEQAREEWIDGLILRELLHVLETKHSTHHEGGSGAMA